MTNRKTIGNRGEDAAADWLEKHGHKVLCRNWRAGRVELDIVTTDKAGIHFVEVKSRVAPAMADPSANVNAVKQKHILAAARGWLSKNPVFSGMEFFFDIVTVLFEREGTTINYYTQAFIPIYV